MLHDRVHGCPVAALRCMGQVLKHSFCKTHQYLIIMVWGAM
ncbi:hypothetical protein HMPREF3034_01235 [Prevotella sp. DNF00663]|nr:hypothetical protein HMPREF3034_01235 [Prevotella sp. DNF00663]